MTPAWNAAKFNPHLSPPPKKSMNHDLNSISTSADHLATCFETRTKE